MVATMKLSEMVDVSKKKRLTFREVTRTIGVAQTYANEEQALANLADQQRETERFNAEKQAHQDDGFAGMRASFLEARQAFHAQAGPFHRHLSTVLTKLGEASKERRRLYRKAYHTRCAALDEGVENAAAIYSEFAPYLHNRRWLRSYAVRLPLPERIAWGLVHTVMLFGVILELAQTPSWSAFLQEPLLLLWGGLWVLSLLRWGLAWGLGTVLRRRDHKLFNALRGQYHAFDISSKQAALIQSLPAVSLDLAVLVAPTPDDDEETEGTRGQGDAEAGGD